MNLQKLIEDWFPVARSGFRLDEIAKTFSCTTTHVWNLIKEGEIPVPAENIDKARSRSCILVPRDSLVAFVIKRGKVPMS